jgi:cold shock CspA family protein
MSVPVELGTIKALYDRGYGFIEPTSTGKADIFFHASQCLAEFLLLEPGLKVSFCRSVDAKTGKPCAVAVRVIGEPTNGEI